MTDYAAAFPINPPLDPRGGSAPGYPYPQAGLLMRDYFAAKAMQGFCTSRPCVLYAEAAAEAYRMADAMMAERCKPTQTAGEQP